MHALQEVKCFKLQHEYCNEFYYAPYAQVFRNGRNWHILLLGARDMLGF